MLYLFCQLDSFILSMATVSYFSLVLLTPKHPNIRKKNLYYVYYVDVFIFYKVEMKPSNLNKIKALRDLSEALKNTFVTVKIFFSLIHN